MPASHTVAFGISSRSAAGFTGWLSRIAQWHQRWRQRQALASLSDHALQDLALTRADIEHEYAKPFWRA